MGYRYDNERFRREESEGWGGQQRSRRRGDESGGSFGRGGHSYDREENYFGSGRQQYGSSYTGTDQERGSGSYGRDMDDDYTTRRGVFGSPQGGGEYRNRYGSSGSFGRRDFSGMNQYGQRSSGYGQGEYSQGSYDPTYSGSERGYQSGRGGNDQDRGWWDRASDEVSSWFGDKDAERRRDMDERRDQSYRGRGPRNYSRSDERITEDINDRLTDDYMLDASDIEVSVQGGEVTLTGSVYNRTAKRRAEDIAESVSGVKNVENRIRVNNEASTNFGSYTNGSTETTSGMSRGKSA